MDQRLHVGGRRPDIVGPAHIQVGIIAVICVRRVQFDGRILHAGIASDALLQNQRLPVVRRGRVERRWRWGVGWRTGGRGHGGIGGIGNTQGRPRVRLPVLAAANVVVGGLPVQALDHQHETVVLARVVEPVLHQGNHVNIYPAVGLIDHLRYGGIGQTIKLWAISAGPRPGAFGAGILPGSLIFPPAPDHTVNLEVDRMGVRAVLEEE